MAHADEVTHKTFATFAAALSTRRRTVSGRTDDRGVAQLRHPLAKRIQHRRSVERTRHDRSSQHSRLLTECEMFQSDCPVRSFRLPGRASACSLSSSRR